MRLNVGLVLFSFILPHYLWAANMLLDAKAGSWSFNTQNVRSHPDSKSGFGAYSFEFGYAFKSKILGVIGANFLMSDGFSGSTGYGFDIGARYYPITDALTSNTETETTSIRVQEKWRPYGGLFFRQRDFNLALQSGYLGPGIAAGLDYNYSPNWHFNFELRYDMLYGSGNATATQMNILFGAGIEL
ncbi:MAG: hypothetical protein H6623_07790 [Bdellovibrionaceae bacterium]|nr:hypothetical protein [Pseudobdellovibrionaceae bacterium]